MRLDPQTIRALQTVSGLGCSISLCLGGSIMVGFWADQRLHTKPYLVLVGMLVGLFGSGAIIYNLMTALSNRKKDNSDGKH